jgi:hypothetical protein
MGEKLGNKQMNEYISDTERQCSGTTHEGGGWMSEFV